MCILADKRIIVAGVANDQSIAWGIAECLSAAGASIVLLCHRGRYRRVKKLSRQINCDAVIPCDVTSDADIKAAFDAVAEIFDDRLDGLVHSVAYARLQDLGGEFISIDREGWNQALEASAYSLVALTSAARPLMLNAGGGSIVALTFVGGEKIVPGYNIMGVAKAALNMSLKYLAYDLGPDNIRVNGIASGPIQTMSSAMVENFTKSLKLTQTHAPLLKTVSPDDIGEVALFLISGRSRGITGQIIYADSGLCTLAAPVLRHPKA